MIIKELYKYTREGGGVTVSTEKPNCEYVEAFRIIAEEGKGITKDGTNIFCCIDVDDPSGWYEIEIEEEL